MAHSNEDESLISSINVTPLVDVVLVLLIILMVTAQFVSQQRIPLELPNAATGEEAPSSVSLSIDRQGTLYLNGQRSSHDEARAALRALLAEDPHLSAVIAADGRVAHQAVVDVMDTLRALGIARFAFNVDPPDSP